MAQLTEAERKRLHEATERAYKHRVEAFLNGAPAPAPMRQGSLTRVSLLTRRKVG